jgi:hypothetical protein
MLSLPSSGKDRERSIKRDMVLDLFLRRGPLWRHVSAIRERWKIEPRVEVPRPTCGYDFYTPKSPEPQQAQEASGDVGRWVDELVALHEAVVPEEGHFLYSDLSWRGFLSMCVCFDPPDTRLEEFADNLGWEEFGARDRAAATGYAMHSAPIVYLRDPEQVEAAVSAFYQELIEALCKKYLHPQGITTEEALDSVFKEETETERGPLTQLYGKWIDLDEQHQPYIDVQPHHTVKDIASAGRMLKAEHEARPSPGRKNRDELTAVQCAIFHERHGWKYEKIAEHYGMDPGSNSVSKYIADGRRILKESQAA